MAKRFGASALNLHGTNYTVCRKYVGFVDLQCDIFDVRVIEGMRCINENFRS